MLGPSDLGDGTRGIGIQDFQENTGASHDVAMSLKVDPPNQEEVRKMVDQFLESVQTYRTEMKQVTGDFATTIAESMSDVMAKMTDDMRENFQLLVNNVSTMVQTGATNWTQSAMAVADQVEARQQQIMDMASKYDLPDAQAQEMIQRRSMVTGYLPAETLANAQAGVPEAQGAVELQADAMGVAAEAQPLVTGQLPLGYQYTAEDMAGEQMQMDTGGATAPTPEEGGGGGLPIGTFYGVGRAAEYLHNSPTMAATLENAGFGGVASRLGVGATAAEGATAATGAATAGKVAGGFLSSAAKFAGPIGLGLTAAQIGTGSWDVMMDNMAYERETNQTMAATGWSESTTDGIQQGAQDIARTYDLTNAQAQELADSFQSLNIHSSKLSETMAGAGMAMENFGLSAGQAAAMSEFYVNEIDSTPQMMMGDLAGMQYMAGQAGVPQQDFIQQEMGVANTAINQYGNASTQPATAAFETTMMGLGRQGADISGFTATDAANLVNAQNDPRVMMYQAAISGTDMETASSAMLGETPQSAQIRERMLGRTMEEVSKRMANTSATGRVMLGQQFASRYGLDQGDMMEMAADPQKFMQDFRSGRSVSRKAAQKAVTGTVDVEDVGGDLLTGEFQSDPMALAAGALGLSKRNEQFLEGGDIGNRLNQLQQGLGLTGSNGLSPAIAGAATSQYAQNKENLAKIAEEQGIPADMLELSDENAFKGASVQIAGEDISLDTLVQAGEDSEGILGTSGKSEEDVRNLLADQGVGAEAIDKVMKGGLTSKDLESVTTTNARGKAKPVKASELTTRGMGSRPGGDDGGSSVDAGGVSIGLKGDAAKMFKLFSDKGSDELGDLFGNNNPEQSNSPWG